MLRESDKKFILERVYVETPVDTDGDGLRDLILVWITRPVTDEKVPAVLVANPYLMTCNEEWYDLHGVDVELKEYTAQNIDEPNIVMASGADSFGEYIDLCVQAGSAGSAPRKAKGQACSDDIRVEGFPEFECITNLYGHLNDRGYASVFAGGLGTRGSDGSTLTGSIEEIAVFRAIIDWLNGRARGFSDKTSGMEVSADWCTGNVAMSGRSYLGTLCYGVAATGVEGLKTIIPEAGISNWYEYYRYNGLCVPAFDWQGDDSDLLSLYCMSRAKDPEDFASIEAAYRKKLADMVKAEDRDSGNYNEFWDARNYLKHAMEFKASAFIIHGLNDWNVKSDQAIKMFRALSAAGKECRMMLHQGEHISIFDLKDSGCLEAVDRWLDHYLKGIDNGAENEQRILVESNLDQSNWYSDDTWPPENTEFFDFPVGEKEYSGDMVKVIDELSETAYDKETDDRKAWRDQLVLEDCDPGEKNNRCLKFFAGPFEEDIRITGSVRVSFRAYIDKPVAIFSAMLVDLGKARRISPGNIIIDGTPGNPDEFLFGTEDEPSEYKIITRGWLNAQNRDNNWSKKEIISGKLYDYEIEMVGTDHTLPAGHQLELILYGSDADFTLRPSVKTCITYEKNSIKCVIPVIKIINRKE